MQQNVPAWLVFAIFFVGIPFSNTFIKERQLGTQRRLRTVAISAPVQFLGKLDALLSRSTRSRWR